MTDESKYLSKALAQCMEEDLANLPADDQLPEFSETFDQKLQERLQQQETGRKVRRAGKARVLRTIGISAAGLAAASLLLFYLLPLNTIHKFDSNTIGGADNAMDSVDLYDGAVYDEEIANDANDAIENEDASETISSAISTADQNHSAEQNDTADRKDTATNLVQECPLSAVYRDSALIISNDGDTDLTITIGSRSWNLDAGASLQLQPEEYDFNRYAENHMLTIYFSTDSSGTQSYQVELQ